MNVKRLNMMKDALIKADAKGVILKMNSWADVPFDKRAALESADVIGLDEAHACGTACCIAGWAATHPGLQDDGLYLNVSGPYGLALHLQENSYVQVVGKSSLASFFGITDVQSTALFSDYLEGIDDEYELLGVNSRAAMMLRDAWLYRGMVENTSLKNAVVVIDKILAEGEKA